MHESRSPLRNLAGFEQFQKPVFRHISVTHTVTYAV